MKRRLSNIVDGFLGVLLIFALLGLVTPQYLTNPNAWTSKMVIVASGAGCAINSSLTAAHSTGTDASVCAQTQLNLINAAGGGEFVVDGPMLISAANVPGGSTGQTSALQMGPNTSIRCTNNGGFFLADNSNVAPVSNTLSGNPNVNLYQTNFSLHNCIFNLNGANQSRYEQANANNQWVFGPWFSGFNGLLIDHVQIWNARTFGMIFANGLALTINDSAVVQIGGYGAGGNNHDCVHFWGTLQNVNIKHLQCIFGDDDALPFNTDEGIVNYNGVVANGGWQPNRMPNTSGGAISDVQIDDVYLDGQNDAVRWIGYVVTGGVATVSNISLKNIHGTVTTFGATQSGITATGGISIDGWWVLPTSVNGLTVPPGALPLTLKNISTHAAVTIPAGDNTSVELGPTLIAYNNVLFNGASSYNSGTPYALGQFDGTGDFILGSTQPYEQLWANNHLQAAIDSTATGSGFANGTFSVPSGTKFLAQGVAEVSGTLHYTNTNLPTASAGTVATYSTNNFIAITGLTAATTVTITFNPAWNHYVGCAASPGVTLATAPAETALSATAVTFTFPSLTGSLVVVCNGN